MNTGNAELWQSLVFAEQGVAKLRAAINSSDARIEMLAAALTSGADVWNQRAALNFLAIFPRDVPRFVPQLFDLALGGRWENDARKVLASGPRDEVVPEVVRLAAAHLPRPDAEDYLQLASLLAVLGAGEALFEVAAAALDSSDDEIQAAGRFIHRHYAAVLPPKSR
jgi:hypothetical protein